MIRNDVPGTSEVMLLFMFLVFFVFSGWRMAQVTALAESHLVASTPGQNEARSAAH